MYSTVVRLIPITGCTPCADLWDLASASASRGWVALSQAGVQTAAFFRDVVRTGRVWTVRDAGAPKSASGQRVPSWSSQSRVRLIIANVPAYEGSSRSASSWATGANSGCRAASATGSCRPNNWSGPPAAPRRWCCGASA